MRGAGDQRIGSATARVRDAARGAAGGDEHRLRITLLHRDRPDAAAEELGCAKRAAPTLAAVLRLVDSHAHFATAAAGVGFAGARPDGLAVGIVRVQLERGHALVLERRRDKLPGRPFVLGRVGIIHGQRVVGAPHAAVRRGDPEGAGVRRGLAVRRDDPVHGPAAEVLGAGRVDGAVAEDVCQVVLPVRRSEGHPFSGAERRPPEQAEPVVARGRERSERRRPVVAAVDGMLDPVLLRVALGVVAGVRVEPVGECLLPRELFRERRAGHLFAVPVCGWRRRLSGFGNTVCPLGRSGGACGAMSRAGNEER